MIKILRKYSVFESDNIVMVDRSRPIGPSRLSQRDSAGSNKLRWSKREMQYILERRMTRLDGGPVRLAPEGNEIAFSLLFKDNRQLAQDVILPRIVDKRVLVVPAFSTSPFFLKKKGAREVVGVDIDPVVTTWMKALRLYYSHEHLGDIVLSGADLDLLMDITIAAARQKWRSRIPIENNSTAIAETLKGWIMDNVEPKPMEGVSFVRASLGPVPGEPGITMALASKSGFDFVYVPHVFGEEGGIVTVNGVKDGLEDIWQLANPGAIVFVGPSNDQLEEALSRPEIADKYAIKTKIHYLGFDEEEILLEVTGK